MGVFRHAGEIPPLPSFLYLRGDTADGPPSWWPRILELRAGKLGFISGPSLPKLLRGQARAGSLTGAVRLSNGNAGVPRRAQRGRKPRVEQKGKSSLDLDFQYEYGPRKRGLAILLTFNLRVLSKRCQKSYHRDNWLVAAKRS